MKPKPAEMNVEQYRLSMTHKQLQDGIVQAAKIFGYRVYFTWKSFHSPKGFPDLVMVKEISDKKAIMVVCEVKTEKGKLSVEQAEWLNLLAEVPGVYTFVVYPSTYDLFLLTLQGLPDIINAC